MARKLVARTKSEIDDAALRVNLIELIETVIIYKLPRLNREEIQSMLQIHDIRESRVYQEAKEEGREEVREEVLREVILKMVAQNISVAKIAKVLQTSVKEVQHIISKPAE